MGSKYFEDINKATSGSPYLDFESLDINYVAHFHEEVEIIFCVSGVVEVKTESRVFNICENDICIFMPGEIHSFESKTKSKLYILKLFSKTQIENLDFSLIRLKKSTIHKNESCYNSIFNIIKKIKEEYTQKKPGYEFAINMYSNNLLMTILRELPNYTFEMSEKKRLNERQEFLDTVNNYIEDNYMQNILLTVIARQCGFSKYYFAHKFKEITNLSFFEYLTVYRLKKALTMMEFSNNSITEIAFACGFSNIRSFNRMFKSHYLKTPTEYRKLQ